LAGLLLAGALAAQEAAPAAPPAAPDPAIQPTAPPPVATKRRPPRARADALAKLPKDATPVEIEGALAQSTDLYLIIDPVERMLEVRARGIVLDRVPLTASAVLSASHVLSAPAPRALPSPSLWRVQRTPEDAVREIIAPNELREYIPEEERQEAAAGTTRAKPRQEARPPVAYRIALNDGWNLGVSPRLPPRGLWQRWLQAAQNGWDRLTGTPTAHPPTLALAMAAEDCQRLHHIFRQGLAILLAPGHIARTRANGAGPAG
jgi:hypothetical protein